MFEGFPKSKFDIVGPEGELRGSTSAIHTGELIVVSDPSLVILPGDEMRRGLPNGTDETFEVVDPQFYEKMHGIPAHFQVKVRRKGTFAHNTGGHLNITISGPNARLNLGSTDNSTNIVGDSTVLGDIRTAVNAAVSDPVEQGKLLSAIDQLDQAHGTNGFVAAYKRFMEVAADHMGVIGPFLPALAGLLG